MRSALNNRGVALLIVLLVTALLVALVFEFAYGTRVSLRAAVNFRDSQRAYFLARAGVNFAGRLLADNKKNNKLRDNLEQRDWQVIPFVSGRDVELRVRWEDEGGKINVGPLYYNTNQEWFRELLTNIEVSQDVAEKIQDAASRGNKINLITGLHQFMSDEEFNRVQSFLTVFSSGAININTAPESVLKSVLRGKTTSSDEILMSRKDKPITVLNTDINTVKYATTSDYFKVFSYATVSEYTRQVEAVIERTSLGFTIHYWRSL
jgi:general secretion pathway protein K